MTRGADDSEKCRCFHWVVSQKKLHHVVLVWSSGKAVEKYAVRGARWPRPLDPSRAPKECLPAFSDDDNGRGDITRWVLIGHAVWPTER